MVVQSRLRVREHVTWVVGVVTELADRWRSGSSVI